jgi:glucosamine kinase
MQVGLSNRVSGPESYALGLDAGGTSTRWAVVDSSGGLVSTGAADAISGVQLLSATGVLAVKSALQAISSEIAKPVGALWAGVTGFDASALTTLGPLLQEAFVLKPERILAVSDIELLCRTIFDRRRGAVVYAGTGSVAASIDPDGTLQRAGGRGPLIDDAGSGYWISCEALKMIWRAEDAAPGTWKESPLALRIFKRIGGNDWPATRQWVYGASRGDVGTLAIEVAAAAIDGDQNALDLLKRAGAELARLPVALMERIKLESVVLAGRAFELHPAIEQSFSSILPSSITVARLKEEPHVLAARGARTLLA